MSTGAEFANFVFKRLTAAEDFSTRFLDFLLSGYRELAVRVFATQGVFDTKITIGGSANPDEVVLAQGAPGDFRGTDQLGNIIGLGASGSEDAAAGQIKAFQIENTLLQTYHLSMQYTEVPRGIQINPRNGVPQYTKIVQAVGVKAAPNAVVDNGGSLTFTIDSVCESGQSHAGRTAIVYKVAPVRGAITEALAIETCVVSWNGLNNRITTVDVFGQDTVSTTPADYLVVLLGPSVRTVDTSGTAGHTYLGTIVGTGAGNTLGAGDNSNQNLIDQSLSSLTLYPGGPNWADGTTNPATTIVAQITKIISDLTSTTGQRGLGKLTAASRQAWHDGTTNPETNAHNALNKIIGDLVAEHSGSGADKIGAKALPTAWVDAVTIGVGSVHDQLDAIIQNLVSTSGNRGLGKLTAAALANWADGTTNPAATAAAALAKIITDLTSTTGQRGAGKITAPARSNWQSGTTNPAVRVDEALEKIITDLTGSSPYGASQISAHIDVNWHDGNGFTPGSISSQLVAIVEKLTIDGHGSDRIDSALIESVQAGPIPADIVILAAGSIEDQLRELVREAAAPLQLANFAARNYNVREAVISSTSYFLRDIITRSVQQSPYQYYAIGDNGSGTSSDIRTASGHPGVAWTTGPAWNGIPTRPYQLCHDPTANELMVIGDDSAGAWCEWIDEGMTGSWATSLPVSNTDLNGRACHYCSFNGNIYGGFYEKVAGTGVPIQYKANPSSSWINASPLSALRGVYTFAENSGDSVLLAGGIDSSGNAMIVKLSSGGNIFGTDCTPASPPSASVRRIVYDDVREQFWCILSNGDVWYGSKNGETWTKLANGTYTLYSDMAVDPYSGVLVFSSGGNNRLFVSIDGHYGDEIGVGDEVHWEDLGVVKWINGRFLVGAQNDLLIGATMRGGERQHLWMG